MNIHKNARLTPSGRGRIARQIESGQTPEAAARAAGVCPRAARKWFDWYRREGLTGLQDRSSRPRWLYRATPQVTLDEVERLRRQRFTGKQIAAELGISPATVSRILKRLGLTRIGTLEPANRYFQIPATSHGKREVESSILSGSTFTSAQERYGYSSAATAIAGRRRRRR